MENAIRVTDEKTKKQLKTVDLSIREGPLRIPFSPHSIISFADNKYIVVTVSIPKEQRENIYRQLKKNTNEHIHLMTPTDEVVLLQTMTDKIVKRISVGVNLGVKHSILTLDNKFLYTTAESGNAVYKIDMKSYKVVGFIQLPVGSNPHDIGISKDGKELFVRNSQKSTTYRILMNKEMNFTVVSDVPLSRITWSKHSDLIL